MRNVSHSAVQPSPQGVITLAEALRIYDSGEPFSICFVTADRKKGTGGELRYYAAAQKCVLSNMPANLLKRNGLPSTAGINPRNPNHYEHKTRNLYVASTGEIRKFHIKLVVAFNNKRVLL